MPRSNARPAPPIVPAWLLIAVLTGCGDPGAVTLADRPAPAMSHPDLSADAAAFVDETVATRELEPVCSVGEAAAVIRGVDLRTSPATPDDAAVVIVTAYLSRDCSPCFVASAVEAGVVFDLHGDRDPEVDAEVIRASLPPDVAGTEPEGETDADLQRRASDRLATDCDEWQSDLNAELERTREDPPTTQRPADGPNETSYGNADDEYGFGDLGRLVVHPEAGPEPVLRWAVTCPVASMAVSDGIVYVMDIAAEVAAYDLATGAERWRTGPAEGADPEGGDRISVVGDAVRVFTPDGYSAELDAATGAVRSVEPAAWDAESPWPEQRWSAGPDEDDYSGIDGWEPRVTADSGSVEGRTPDGRLGWEATGPAWIDPLPYAIRSGSTVVFADATGYLVAVDWP